jgi:hypothetical protein
VGRFSGTKDPALKELGKLLDSTVEAKLEYISKFGQIELDPEADTSHINRMAMMIYHCKLQHKANGLREKTLPKFIQGEMQQCALDACRGRDGFSAASGDCSERGESKAAVGCCVVFAS